jgi:predicted DNA-binding protein (UPF0251 family)
MNIFSKVNILTKAATWGHILFRIFSLPGELMPKPKKERKVQSPPAITYFKPQGIPMAQLEQIVLHVDEYEAIRLVDYENLDQEKAAKKLGISRPTCARIVAEAHRKIGEAITLGKAIRIEGGNFRLVQNILRCRDCGALWKAPQKSAAGSDAQSADAACPECESTNAIDLGEALSRGQGGGRRHRGRRGR